MSKSLKKSMKLDPQLDLFKKRNKKYKEKNLDSGWSMAPRTRMQKVTGIHCASSDSWQLDSKDNIYGILPDNKLEWKVKTPTITSRIGEFNFILAKGEKIVDDIFPSRVKGNQLIIQYGDLKKCIFIKESGLHKMNKGITPAGTEGRTNKKGKPTKKWCKVAIFSDPTYIVLWDCLWLEFSRDTTGQITKDTKKKEANGETSFHYAFGYCKLEDDDEHMYGTILLSKDYLKQTKVNICVGRKFDKKKPLSITIQPIHEDVDRAILLYPTNQFKNNSPKQEAHGLVNQLFQDGLGLKVLKELKKLKQNNNNNNNNTIGDKVGGIVYPDYVSEKKTDPGDIWDEMSQTQFTKQAPLQSLNQMMQSNDYNYNIHNNYINNQMEIPNGSDYINNTIALSNYHSPMSITSAFNSSLSPGSDLLYLNNSLAMFDNPFDLNDDEYDAVNGLDLIVPGSNNFNFLDSNNNNNNNNNNRKRTLDGDKPQNKKIKIYMF